VGDSSIAGLTSAEVDDRRRRLGPRRSVREHGTLPLSVLSRQFGSPFVLILLAAAALTLALGQWDEALIISVIVAASSLLGFAQEYSAGRTVEALRARLSTNVRVWRDGRLTSCPLSDIVPDDIVELAAGSIIPADGTVLEANGLTVDEAALTGEPLAVLKRSRAEGADEETYRLYLGTSVRSGTGRMVCQSVGMETVYGRLADRVRQSEPESAFSLGVRRFGMLMTQVMIVVVLVVLVVNLALGRPLLDSFLFAAALAVGITPELLPAVITVTLATGARALAQVGVLVKRLAAIENLGAMDVLCTDKTGTLTEGELVLLRAEGVDGASGDAAAHLAYVNARLQTGLTNPLDEAILKHGDLDTDRHGLVGEVPFDFERKRLSVIVDGANGRRLICKGAVNEILRLCSMKAGRPGDRPMAAADIRDELERLAAWSRDGLRAVAVAFRQMGEQDHFGVQDEAGLTLAGYLLFSDPLKADVASTVHELRQQGVVLKLITGDNRYAAAHIARQAGLAGPVLTGEQLAKFGARALTRKAASTSIFAEVTPEQKERLVGIYKRMGHVVGYLGDGINDAPALRSADVGISVDEAVDVAREAADIVLLRRDLAVILRGLTLGRKSFVNTLKYIRITISANLGNMLSLAVASMWLPFLPLLAKQVLVNNLLSDIPLLAVSSDRVDPTAMAAAGRWNFGGLVRSMMGFGAVSSAFDLVTFLVLLGAASSQPDLVRTGWFIESLLSEIVIIFVMRTGRPFYLSRPGGLLSAAAIAVALVGVALPWTPLGPLLGLVPVPLPLLASLIAIVLLYAAASELLKLKALS